MVSSRRGGLAVDGARWGTTGAALLVVAASSVIGLTLGTGRAGADSFPAPGTFSSLVPAGVTTATVTVVGGHGGRGGAGTLVGPAGGVGGSVTATIPVAACTTLTVNVGGNGGNGTTANVGGTAGSNGGAVGGTSTRRSREAVAAARPRSLTRRVTGSSSLVAEAAVGGSPVVVLAVRERRRPVSRSRPAPACAAPTVRRAFLPVPASLARKSPEVQGVPAPPERAAARVRPARRAEPAGAPRAGDLAVVGAVGVTSGGGGAGGDQHHSSRCWGRRGFGVCDQRRDRHNVCGLRTRRWLRIDHLQRNRRILRTRSTRRESPLHWVRSRAVRLGSSRRPSNTIDKRPFMTT